MGNEGNGISTQVRSLVTNPLRIPSFPEGAPTAESLNVAIATAVILAQLRQPAELQHQNATRRHTIQEHPLATPR